MKQFFNFYRDVIWPIQRRFVSVGPRCPTCGISIHAALSFVNGICDKCQYLSKRQHPLPDNAGLPYSLTIGEGEDYDAVVMLSGGKDSLYLLHRLIDEHDDIRILAYTYDTGFMSEYAMSNIKRAVVLTGVDHELSVANRDKLWQATAKAILERRRAAFVDYIEGKRVFEDAGVVAEAHGVPLVCGLAKEQASSLETDGVVCPLAQWMTPESEIADYLGGYGYELDSALTNSTIIPALVALDMLRFGYCSFEDWACEAVRQGRAPLKKWRNTFECLEWFSKKGLLNREIRQLCRKLKLDYHEVLK